MSTTLGTILSTSNLQAISSSMDARYLFSQCVPTVTITDPVTGNQINTLDIFNPQMINAINSLKRQTYYRYNNEKPTYIAYLAYGNTTAYWLILLMSQIIYPYKIPSGTLLSIPILAYFTQALATQASSNIRTPTYITI